MANDTNPAATKLWIGNQPDPIDRWIIEVTAADAAHIYAELPRGVIDRTIRVYDTKSKTFVILRRAECGARGCICAMAFVLPQNIKTEEDVRTALLYYAARIGSGFQIDKDGEDYIADESGRSLFSGPDAETYDLVIWECVNVCGFFGLDVYAIAREIMAPLMLTAKAGV